MARVRSFIKRLTTPILRRWLTYYYRKPRLFTFEDIKVTVHPDVFPPQLTLSTKILLEFLSNRDLQGKTFLELGCGSGIISLYARKRGAIVTASDINETALEYLERASKDNGLEIECVHSDLFQEFEGRAFNEIIINPPYYPKEPSSVKEKAWYCGEDFDYFKALFEQLPNYLGTTNNTFMILSEDCDEAYIQEIGNRNGIIFQAYKVVRRMGERNTIYRLSL